MTHVVEVDQSGKVEDTGQDTVIAFSNGSAFSILIPASVKRVVYKEFRSRRMSTKQITLQLFSIGLYLLMRDFIGNLVRFTIDVEYTGQDVLIKEKVVSLLKRGGYSVDPQKIQFSLVGKKSPSHDLAIAVFRKEQPPNLTVTLEQVMNEFENRKQKKAKK